MKRIVCACVAAGVLACVNVIPLGADVKTQEKGHAKFEGMLGRVVNIFGGKAAREGVVSNVAVKGDRKSTMSDTSGQIIDLAEEKVYDLDVRKKTYTVTTFEDIRKRIQEAREKAEKDAREAGEEKEPAQQDKELEMDFDVRETGQKKTIAGHPTRQVIVTITVREKGKTLEQSGGLVLATDSWLAPPIPAMAEIHEFDMRYAKQIDSAALAGGSAEQYAAAMAMFPGLQNAMARMQSEGAKLQGTPLESTMVVESVKSPEQMAEAKEQGGGGGLGGMLARRVAKKKEPSPRSTVLTVNHQVLSVSPTVAPDDVQVPAGFKQKS